MSKEPKLKPGPKPIDPSTIDPTLPLENVRHERFCQLVSSGIKPSAAYSSAGYSSNGSHASAYTLAKNRIISNRVRYLQARFLDAHEQVVKGAAIDMIAMREQVIRNLVELARLSKAAKQYGTSTRCEQLLGQAAGVFTAQSEPEWDGDLAKLSAAQRMKLQQTLEQDVYGDDTARLQADKEAWLKERAEKRAAEAAAAAAPTAGPGEPTVQ